MSLPKQNLAKQKKLPDFFSIFTTHLKVIFISDRAKQNQNQNKNRCSAENLRGKLCPRVFFYGLVVNPWKQKGT